MNKPATYYRTRLRLCGMFGRFPAGVMCIVLCLLLESYASGKMTPASVSVSGYTRRDGTRVSGYSRRPPGSVKHDAPFQFVSCVSWIGVLGGLYLMGGPLLKLVFCSDYELFPPIDPRKLTEKNDHWRVLAQKRALRAEQFAEHFGYELSPEEIARIPEGDL